MGARTTAGRGAAGTSAGGPARARVAGVDAARGAALLGMMATHIVPLLAERPGGPEATWAAVLFAGKASALFATLAGVGLGLLTGGPRPVGGPRLSGLRRGIAARAACVFALGLFCGLFNTHVAVILAHYGVLFLAVLPFLHLRARALGWWAAGWLALSPALLWLLLPGIRAAVSPDDAGGSPTLLDLARPATLAADLLATGFYPVLVWTGFVLLGLFLARCDLLRWRTALAAAAAGGAAALAAKAASGALLALPGARASLAGAAGVPAGDLPALLAAGQGLDGIVASPWWWAVSAPHTTAPLDVLHVAAAAACALGAAQLLFLALGALPGGLGRAATALWWPLTGAGAATLTLYTAHLVAFDLMGGSLDPYPRLPVYVWFAVGALLAGIAVKWSGRRGPLEAAVHAFSAAAAGQAARR